MSFATFSDQCQSSEWSNTQLSWCEPLTGCQYQRSRPGLSLQCWRPLVALLLWGNTANYPKSLMKIPEWTLKLTFFPMTLLWLMINTCHLDFFFFFLKRTHFLISHFQAAVHMEEVGDQSINWAWVSFSMYSSQILQSEVGLVLIILPPLAR